jgi:hypothetical protein
LHVAHRISLGEETPGQQPAPRPPAVREPVAASASGPAFADWDDPRNPPLLLYLADEPELGREFEYGGARWEIVDYRDGWVARLLVAP